MKIDYRNAPLCVLLCTAATAYKTAYQHIADSRSSCLPTRLHPVEVNKFTEDILYKIYTEKCEITGM